MTTSLATHPASIIQMLLDPDAAMAMNNHQSNTSPSFDSQFANQRVINNNNNTTNNMAIMMFPQSNVVPRHQPSELTQSMVILPSKVSLIDNTLAQACSMRRIIQQASSSSSSPSDFKRSNSDSSMMRHHSAKFTYKNRTPGSSGATVRIVSSNTTPRNSEPDLSSSPTLNIEDMCPYTYIESVLIGDDDDLPDDEDDEIDQQQQPTLVDNKMMLQPLHESEFLRPTEEEIAAYSNDAIAAVRTSDVEALRRIHATGQTLRCCNRFGESLLHVACRRSNANVVSFLVKEANVSPLIKDDYGRTPLHDACWRGNPEYEIVELLLSVEPRLAYVSDVRGHKPFNYARREHWGAWREFLEQKKDLILS